MKKLLLITLLFFLCNRSYLQKSQFAGSKFIYKIIIAPSKTFGYDIYCDKKLLIHQSSVPALAGNNGFKRKSDATKVAKLVIIKLTEGEMPPTVSIEEMKNLNVMIKF